MSSRAFVKLLSCALQPPITRPTLTTDPVNEALTTLLLASAIVEPFLSHFSCCLFSAARGVTAYRKTRNTLRSLFSIRLCSFLSFVTFSLHRSSVVSLF